MRYLKIHLCLSLALLLTTLLSGQPGAGSPFIHLDQFGYLPEARKVAVISNPMEGFNAAQSFSPANSYELRSLADGSTVWTGSPQPWNSGQTHDQSGDQGWWLDFSSITTSGEYYLYDPVDNVYSHTFQIGADVYQEILKQALRVFFYQRIGFAKQAPYADALWTDAACFEGANQDPAARSRWAKNDPTTERDLRGGWMDAGDVNKYTTFAENVILQLLQAYRLNPTVFGDDYEIPESGNGIPDILDEVLWELDWLKRMQDGTGTDGFFLKLGVDNFDTYSPPSLDPRPRYYLPECTSATLAGCAMFAYAGVVLQESGISSLQTYATDLTSRAQAAWVRAKTSTSNFTSFEEDCDDGDIKAGDADRDATGQMQSALVAAIYLYESTGDMEYKNFVETQYTNVPPYSENWWGPYNTNVGHALLNYSELPNVSATVAANIRGQKTNMNYQNSIDNYNSQTDLYRAYIEDWAHHWGSNQVRSNCGNMNFEFIDFGINTGQSQLYSETAAQYLHWLHGTNPLGMVMLSNMYNYGAEVSVNEIYHSWFDDGTIYDNAQTSPNGPAPAYVVGGPNASFSVPSISPPSGQPVQKSYLDWNTGWPEASWEISEPAIYYQSAYVLLLSRVIATASVPLAVNQLSFQASQMGQDVRLTWTTQGEVNHDYFILERSDDGHHFEALTKIKGTGTTAQIKNYAYLDQAPLPGSSYYRLAAYAFDGSVQFSTVISVHFNSYKTFKLYPNPLSEEEPLIMEYHAREAHSLSAKIVDTRGQVLRSWILEVEAGLHQRSIATEDLPSGVYWLQLQKGYDIQVERFVKR